MKIPYCRTEAGEMVEWFRLRIKALVLSGQWRIRQCTTEVSAFEKMLKVKSKFGLENFSTFCQKTRERKMKLLARKILALRVEVDANDFDTSSSRMTVLLVRA